MAEEIVQNFLHAAWGKGVCTLIPKRLSGLFSTSAADGVTPSQNGFPVG